MAIQLDPSDDRPGLRRPNPVEAALPWITAGLALAGGSFYWGYNVRGTQKLSPEELRQRERQELLGVGWKQSAEGVMTRWCSGDCRPPKLYGGGKAEILEVYCKDRPCGSIRATFRVLDRDGQDVGTTTATREGLHGERLRLVVVSPEPKADRFELEEFNAQALVF
jgi:hypothetical protein